MCILFDFILIFKQNNANIMIREIENEFEEKVRPVVNYLYQFSRNGYCGRKGYSEKL